MYGKTIRKIRQNKGLTLKEIYLGIVSKSFYIEFEKGNYNIEARKFEYILNRLSLTFQEFQFIHNDYQMNEFKNLNDQIEFHYSTWDLISLSNIYHTYKNSSYSRERYAASRAYALIYITEDNSDFMSKAPLNELKAYLTSLKEWSLEDIQNYVSIASAFDFATTKYFFQLAIDSLKKYEEFDRDTYNNLCKDLYMGQIQASLIHQEVNGAIKLLKQMKQKLTSGTTFGINVYIKCCEILISYYEKSFNSLDSEEFIKALDIIDFEGKAQIQALLKTHEYYSQNLETHSLYNSSDYYSSCKNARIYREK